MVADGSHGDVDVASLEGLERIDPGALQPHLEKTGIGEKTGDDHFLRTVANARAERLGDRLLRAPELDDRLRGVRRLRRKLEFLGGEDAGCEFLGKVAGD